MWRAFALGVVTGLRSQVPTVLLAWRQQRGDLPVPIAGPARILQRGTALPLLVLAAAGELMADKLPQTPNRLDPGPLGGRLTLGAAAGAGIAAATGRSQALGIVVGAAGAALGSWAGARYRAVMTERSGVPDAVWALAEDAVAVGIGLAATDTAADPAAADDER